MSIQFTKAYVANGKTYANLMEAQAAELETLFPGGSNNTIYTPGQIALAIVGNAEKIIDILTTTESSRPAARRVNGGTKKRKPKSETPAQPELKAV